MNTVRLNRHEVHGGNYERVDAIFDDRLFADELKSSEKSSGFIYNACLNGLRILRTPSNSADIMAIADPRELEEGVAEMRMTLGSIVDGAIERSPSQTDKLKSLYRHSIEEMVKNLSGAMQEQHRLLAVMKRLIVGVGEISGHDVNRVAVDETLPAANADTFLAEGFDATVDKPLFYSPPYRQYAVKIPDHSVNLMTAIALLDDTSLAETIRDAIRWYIPHRQADPELELKIIRARINLKANQPEE